MIATDRTRAVTNPNGNGSHRTATAETVRGRDRPKGVDVHNRIGSTRHPAVDVLILGQLTVHRTNDLPSMRTICGTFGALITADEFGETNDLERCEACN